MYFLEVQDDTIPVKKEKIFLDDFGNIDIQVTDTKMFLIIKDVKGNGIYKLVEKKLKL